MIFLRFGISFADLNSVPGLVKLDKSFLHFLAQQNQILYNQLLSYRSSSTNQANSEFLLELAPIIDDFISELFDIERENIALKQEHKKFDPIYECRRKFVQRYAIKKYSNMQYFSSKTL